MDALFQANQVFFQSKAARGCLAVTPRNFVGVLFHG